MATPSPGYSITVRVEAPTDPGATARLSGVVAEAGGAITALDVAESRHDMLVVDVSCNASDVEHSESITKAIAALPGFSVRKVSDRTFLLHLGGKIEVNPKVALRHRDDLSAPTPQGWLECVSRSRRTRPTLDGSRSSGTRLRWSPTGRQFSVWATSAQPPRCR